MLCAIKNDTNNLHYIKKKKKRELLRSETDQNDKTDENRKLSNSLVIKYIIL